MTRLVRAFWSLEKKAAVRALAMAISCEPTQASVIPCSANRWPSLSTIAIHIRVAFLGVPDTNVRKPGRLAVLLAVATAAFIIV